MKESVQKSVKIISNLDSITLENNVNAFLQEHRNDLSVNVQFAATTAGHSAYIIYEQKIKTPEDIRDEYILNGEECHCEDCPYWTNNIPGTDYRKLYECSKGIGTSPVRFVTPACLYFYQKLAKGELKKHESR